MAHQQAIDLKPEFLKLATTEDKIAYLIKVLAEDGHNTTWTKADDGSYLIEIANCPYVHISKDHPVICNYDRELFRQILDMDVVKISSICHGDRTCVYQATEKA